MHVTAFSWNCTGNSIAVAYNNYHLKWCHHMGYANFYTFDRYLLSPTILITTFFFIYPS